MQSQWSLKGAGLAISSYVPGKDFKSRLEEGEKWSKRDRESL